MLKIKNRQFAVEIEKVIEDLTAECAAKGKTYFKETKLRKNYLSVTCPYHSGGQEKHASAGFNRISGYFNCFSCGEKHSLPEVIAHCLDIDEAGAMKWLRDHYDFTDTINERKEQLKQKPKKEEPKTKFVDPAELAKYRYIHPYMYQRKLTDKIIRKYDIGYDTQTNCITFPNRDLDGNIVFIARRHTEKKQFSYPPDAEKPVYGLYEIKRDREHGKTINRIIITESMLDALYLNALDMPAVALNGLGSSTQYKILNDFDCRSYILATDNDGAGQAARINLKNALKNKIVREFDYKTFPEGCKDINDMTEEQIRNLKII